MSTHIVAKSHLRVSIRPFGPSRNADHQGHYSVHPAHGLARLDAPLLRQQAQVRPLVLHIVADARHPPGRQEGTWGVDLAEFLSTSWWRCYAQRGRRSYDGSSYVAVRCRLVMTSSRRVLSMSCWHFDKGSTQVELWTERQSSV